VKITARLRRLRLYKHKPTKNKAKTTIPPTIPPIIALSLLRLLLNEDEFEPEVEVGGSVLVPVEVIVTGTLVVVVNVKPPDVVVSVSALIEVSVVV